jgi:hypothetical protein
MSFGEAFRDLDPGKVEQAFARASDKLFIIAQGGKELANQVTDIFNEVEEASPGFMVLFGSMEVATQMISEVPELKYGREWFQMIQMNLGVISVGLVLAEYARLEAEED